MQCVKPESFGVVKKYSDKSLDIQKYFVTSQLIKYLLARVT